MADTTAVQRLENMFCDHTQMASCCEPACGHYSCPCGIYWDEGAEGGFFDDEFDAFAFEAPPS